MGLLTNLVGSGFLGAGVTGLAMGLIAACTAVLPEDTGALAIGFAGATGFTVLPLATTTLACGALEAFGGATGFPFGAALAGALATGFTAGLAAGLVTFTGLALDLTTGLAWSLVWPLRPAWLWRSAWLWPEQPF